MTVTLLRAEARRGVAPREALLNVNRQLIEINETGMFATVLYGVLDFDNNEFAYVRAGHELPIICDRHDELMQLPRGLGQLIGILEEPVFDEQTVKLPPGSTLMLYTDGVNEATNIDGQLYGIENLREAMRITCQNPALSVCNQVLGRLTDFRGSDTLQDDITMVVVKVE